MLYKGACAREFFAFAVPVSSVNVHGMVFETGHNRDRFSLRGKVVMCFVIFDAVHKGIFFE